MKKVVLLRNVGERVQELGNMFVFDNTKNVFQCKTLERAWLDNMKNESCVPPGLYPLVLEWSPRFKTNLWELKDVPNRSECKIHSSNYWFELNGCIAPGDMHLDMNKDGHRDVRNSRNTLTRFHRALHGLTRTTIEIIELE